MNHTINAVEPEGCDIAEIDIVIEDPRWADLGLQTIAVRAVETVLVFLSIDLEETEVSILGCDDARILQLNTEFREKKSATNVLSWPAQLLAAENDGEQPASPKTDVMGMRELGDIALSFDTCAREAELGSKLMTDHIIHLIVHGMLHLLGYDHVRDQDATLMETLEVEILENMGIDDPYYGNRAG